MEFFCGTGFKRPIRLSAATRTFAMRSLQGEYGDEARRTPFVSVDDIAGFDEMEEGERYLLCIESIAKKAPLRLIPEEKICGAATLGAAITHVVPAARQGQICFSSVSHLTMDFVKILRIGWNGLAEEIEKGGAQETKSAYLRMVRAFSVWHARYLSAMQDFNPAIAATLRRVPMEPPHTFCEAVQSLWMTFAFTRLCGNWSGIGRIDAMLEPYLQNDLANGTLTLEEAREILAHFFIKGCEWICTDTRPGSGDAQHYQNLVLGGVDACGREVTGNVSYLVLDILEELPIGDYPVTVRVNENTPASFLRRVAEVMRLGGGVLAVYNEPLVLRSLQSVGYPLEEARKFANDGCWEVQIPGCTDFTYLPFDALTIFLQDVLGLGGEHKTYPDYASVYEAFRERLKAYIDSMYEAIQNSMGEWDAAGQWRWKKYGTTATLVSLLEDGCIQNGREYYQGGTKYVVRAPHIGGAPDVGNSLYAIRKFVFEDKIVSLPQLLDIVENNWEGEEILRQKILHTYPYYGNDSSEADAVTACVLNDFADIVLAHKDTCPIKFIPGVSTFGRQIEWLGQRCATPFGTKKGEILSGNCSPTPGTDMEGATASIRSYCTADLEKQVNGAALDIKLHPSAVRGENGVEAMVGLIRGFAALNGYFMQLDVMDAAVLEEARKHPEAYKTLSVRVSGWNARFVTLCPEWQQMIIERTASEM